MKLISELNCKIKKVFCDIDDTLTTEGKLPSCSYSSLWELQKNGIEIIPITGRPAGWCEMIARFWPVSAVVGENGGFYFCYTGGKMLRQFAVEEEQRIENQKKLKTIETEVLSLVPGCAVASDQFCRMMDLAIDFCEDVPRLSEDQVKKIVDVFNRHGATAKVSSIHVNGWFGSYDKLTMCKLLCEKQFGFRLQDRLDEIAFVGDSPNDEPMFGYFKHSVGVANINNFKDQISDMPKYVCSKEGAEGFSEFASHILKF